MRSATLNSHDPSKPLSWFLTYVRTLSGAYFDDRRDQHVLVCSHDHALFALSAHLRCCAAAQPVRDLHLIRARMRAETTPRLSKIAFGRLHRSSVLVEPTLACCCVHAQQDCSTPATATQMHSPTDCLPAGGIGAFRALADSQQLDATRAARAVKNDVAALAATSVCHAARTRNAHVRIPSSIEVQ